VRCLKGRGRAIRVGFANPLIRLNAAVSLMGYSFRDGHDFSTEPVR
jgi:hypothetical protein